MLPEGWLLTRMFSGTLSVVPRKLILSLVPLLPVRRQAESAAAKVAAGEMFFHWIPVLYQKELVVVSYTSRPLVWGIALRATESIRGISIPLLPDFTSRIALGLGREPSVLMATLCASEERVSNRLTARNKVFLFIV